MRCTGRIEVHSISGDVRLVDDHSSSIFAQTSTGNIVLDGDFLPNGVYRLKNYSGAINVQFSPGDSFDVSATSLYGKVDNQAKLIPPNHPNQRPPRYSRSLFGSLIKAGRSSNYRRSMVQSTSTSVTDAPNPNNRNYSPGVSQATARLNRRLIALTGFMGCGKSTVARLLARQIGWIHADLDKRIVERANMAISDIFAQLGEPAFRKIEHEELRRILGESVEAGAANHHFPRRRNHGPDAKRRSSAPSGLSHGMVGLPG